MEENSTLDGNIRKSATVWWLRYWVLYMKQMWSPKRSGVEHIISYTASW